MAASVPPSGVPGVAFFSSFSSVSKSLSTQCSNQRWKALGAASGVALGLTLTVSKTPALAEKKATLEKSILDRLLETPLPFAWSYNCFASASLSVREQEVEPKTGVVFPVDSPEGKQLTGIGLRKKNILGLKSIIVYAYGVYADPVSLKSTLGDKYGNFTPAELSNKEEMFQDVTESDVGLTVRLVIVYGKLKIGSIRNAFEESVGKSLKKFSGDDNNELLGRFTSVFTDDLKLSKGTTIDLSRLPGQVLQTKIGGQEIGSIQSPLLCQALFDLYIGEQAFDKTAKEEIGLSFGSLLSLPVKNPSVVVQLEDRLP